MDFEFGKVAASAPQSPVFVDLLPVFACVIRPIDSSQLRRIDRSVDPVRVGWGDCEPNAAKALARCRESLCELPPGFAAVSGFVQPAFSTLPRGVLPRALTRFPEVSINNVCILRVEPHLNSARVLIPVEDLLPGLASVDRAKDAPFLVWAVRVPERGDEDSAGISRIYDDRPYLLGVLQSHVAPRLSAVGGFIDSVAH